MRILFLIYDDRDGIASLDLMEILRRLLNSRAQFRMLPQDSEVATKLMVAAKSRLVNDEEGCPVILVAEKEEDFTSGEVKPGDIVYGAVKPGIVMLSDSLDYAGYKK